MDTQAYLLLGLLSCSVASAETIRFDGGARREPCQRVGPSP
jgi:hypothetical protein